MILNVPDDAPTLAPRATMVFAAGETEPSAEIGATLAPAQAENPRGAAAGDHGACRKCANCACSPSPA